MQNVTLGGTGKEVGDRHPKIHSNVLIGAGAAILGNIIVGTGAQVVAGSLVLKPVEARTMVAGSPARCVGQVEGNPAHQMEQWSKLVFDNTRQGNNVNGAKVNVIPVAMPAGHASAEDKIFGNVRTPDEGETDASRPTTEVPMLETSPETSLAPRNDDAPSSAELQGSVSNGVSLHSSSLSLRLDVSHADFGTPQNGSTAESLKLRALEQEQRWMADVKEDAFQSVVPEAIATPSATQSDNDAVRPKQAEQHHEPEQTKSPQLNPATPMQEPGLDYTSYEI